MLDGAGGSGEWVGTSLVCHAAFNAQVALEPKTLKYPSSGRGRASERKRGYNDDPMWNIDARIKKFSFDDEFVRATFEYLITPDEAPGFKLETSVRAHARKDRPLADLEAEANRELLHCLKSIVQQMESEQAGDGG